MLSVLSWRLKSVEVWEPNLHSILKYSLQEILDLYQILDSILQF